MRQHCIRGYELVHKIRFLADPAEIAYSHQEGYDGAGDPRGLPSRQIPLRARIGSVANTLDSITSELTLSTSANISAAPEEICMGAGRQFDPEIVKVFLSLPVSVWSDL
jgi:response regulator RpfG family c-di-GMP phosphodiesterase